MHEHRTDQLLGLPNLLSVARVPLAVAFPVASGNALLALGVVGLAGLTDVLDGWAARKLGQATDVGALVDGVTDKIFAVSVLGTLVATKRLTPAGALVLATRELVELPLAIHLATSTRARRSSVDRRATRFGKLATFFEFATIAAVLTRAKGRTALLAATAVCGAAAAVGYWRRELRAARPVAAAR